MAVLHQLRSYRIGLALSGGSVRGLAHIGVIKALAEADLTPAIVTGSSAGSLIGAFIAAGVSWKELARIAQNTFWPSLLHGESLHRFCSRNLPAPIGERGTVMPFQPSPELSRCSRVHPMMPMSIVYNEPARAYLPSVWF